MAVCWRTLDGPDGRALRVVEDGDSAGAAVVVHHGTPSGGLLFAPWAADTAAIADALGIERFATWGVSGGGPHALACGALLGDRVAAVATLASAAPSDAPDLDFLAGMGEDNVGEFGAAFAGEAVLRPLLVAWAEGILGATPDGLADEMRTILSAVDVDALTGEYAAFLLASINAAIERGVDARLSPDDGHLTLSANRVGEVHAWLRERL